MSRFGRGTKTATAPTPMVVRRVILDENGSSRVDPELDQSWSEFDRLRWQAAVVMLDSGLDRLEVSESSTTCNGRPILGEFDISVGNGVSGPCTFREAWKYMNGIRAGAEAMKQQREREEFLRTGRKP